MALVQHTESKHGRTGVHNGALAWERSRSQVGALTTGRAVAETFYQVCTRTFLAKQEVVAHSSYLKILEILPIITNYHTYLHPTNI